MCWCMRLHWLGNVSHSCQLAAKMGSRRPAVTGRWQFVGSWHWWPGFMDLPCPCVGPRLFSCWVTLDPLRSFFLCLRVNQESGQRNSARSCLRARRRILIFNSIFNYTYRCACQCEHLQHPEESVDHLELRGVVSQLIWVLCKSSVCA